MQVTEMKCGRLVIGCSFDHRVADLHSMSKFLVAWADMTRSNRCRGNKIASVSSPDYRRSLLHPRQPSHSDPAMGNSYYISKAASSDIPQAQQLLHFQSRIYKINARQVQHLQSLAGPSRTKLQSFSALLWKLLAKSTKEDNKRCKLGIVVDGRTYFSKDASTNHKSKSMENYFGNVLSFPYSDVVLENSNQCIFLKLQTKCMHVLRRQPMRSILGDWLIGLRVTVLVEQCARFIQPYLVTQKRLLWSSPRSAIFRSPKWTLVGGTPHLCLFSFLGGAPLEWLCQCPVLPIMVIGLCTCISLESI